MCDETISLDHYSICFKFYFPFLRALSLSIIKGITWVFHIHFCALEEKLKIRQEFTRISSGC